MILETLAIIVSIIVTSENDFRNNEQEVFNIVKKYVSCSSSDNNKTINIYLNDPI